MNRNQAKRIARSGIKNSQIVEMLRKAYHGGAANAKRSQINPGMSKAAVFNPLWQVFSSMDPNQEIRGSDRIAASNALREFGSFWEGEIPSEKGTPLPSVYYHEEAIDITCGECPLKKALPAASRIMAAEKHYQQKEKQSGREER